MGWTWIYNCRRVPARSCAGRATLVEFYINHHGEGDKHSSFLRIETIHTPVCPKRIYYSGETPHNVPTITKRTYFIISTPFELTRRVTLVQKNGSATPLPKTQPVEAENGGRTSQDKTGAGFVYHCRDVVKAPDPQQLCTLVGAGTTHDIRRRYTNPPQSLILAPRELARGHR